MKLTFPVVTIFEVSSKLGSTPSTARQPIIVNVLCNELPKAPSEEDYRKLHKTNKQIDTHKRVVNKRA